MKFKILFFVLLPVFFSLGCMDQPSTGLEVTGLCLRAPPGFSDSVCLEAEIADDPDSMAKGLGYRDSMDQDHGMLFVFQKEGRHGFWMKGMRFPLDIMWLDSNKTIIFIAENLTPCDSTGCPSYGPGTDALYVLETNAGFAGKHNITEGNRVYFKLPGDILS